MSPHEEAAARATLRVAGVFQEVRDVWMKRLDSYFSEVERLVDGEWLDSSDLAGLIKETRLASKEAVDGLANDLSAELLHASSGVFARYEAERLALNQRIDHQRETVSRILATDDSGFRRENQALREAIAEVPEYIVLRTLQRLGNTTYDELSRECGIGKGKIRKYVKSLMIRGHATVNRKLRPHKILFLSAPWDDSMSIEKSQIPPRPVQALPPHV